MKYKTPQKAPWPLLTKLKYTGDSVSGFTNDNGDTVWSHEKGVTYTVVKTNPPSGIDVHIDEDTGKKITTIMHGWSTLQSELDPEGWHMKGIDVESMSDYEVIK
ncbi:MAG: hypothetical protein ACYSWP_23930 [Planctomycetota bacterium]|jgi:hypothetical protein